MNAVALKNLENTEIRRHGFGGGWCSESNEPGNCVAKSAIAPEDSVGVSSEPNPKFSASLPAFPQA